MAWKWIQYEYPVEFVIDHTMIWASLSINCYVGYSINGTDWNYICGEADHSLDANGKLVEAVSQSEAETNFWETGISADGLLAKAEWPKMRQAKYVRLYFNTSCTIYEVKHWVTVVADSIIAGTIHCANGITIASAEDDSNAIKLDSTGLKGWGGGTQRLEITNSGTFWLGAVSGANSLVYDGSIMTLNGTLVITSASGYANISDKPTLGSLAALDTVGASNVDTTIISGGKIITGLLTADNIQAGTLLAARLSTAIAYITNSAQIANAVIANANIGNLEVDSAKIANLTVGTGKITGQAVTRGATYINNAAIAYTLTEIEVGTLTITTNTTGDSVWFWARAVVTTVPQISDGKGGNSPVGTILRIRRDSVTGTIIDQWTISGAWSTNNLPASMNLIGISSPATAGSIVYKLTAEAKGTTALTVNGQLSNRYMMALAKSK